MNAGEVEEKTQRLSGILLRTGDHAVLNFSEV
jgi:hypothetical protein